MTTKSIQVNSSVNDSSVNKIYQWTVSLLLGVPDNVTEEMTDEEFITLPSQTRIFGFWDDPEEDIYSISDGEEIESE